MQRRALDLAPVSDCRMRDCDSPSRWRVLCCSLHAVGHDRTADASRVNLADHAKGATPIGLVSTDAGGTVSAPLLSAPFSPNA